MTVEINTAVVGSAASLANSQNRSLLLVLIGTRPCYIKLAPLIAALEMRNIAFVAVESGQHYDSHLTHPKIEFGYSSRIGIRLNVNGTLSDVAAGLHRAVVELTTKLRQYNLQHPPVLAVSGDTITAAIMPQAWYLQTGVRSMHIEAGLRSFAPDVDWLPIRAGCISEQRGALWNAVPDDPFPEGLCTRLASGASELLFAPVDRNRSALINEGFSPATVEVVGSLSSDVVRLIRHQCCDNDIPATCRNGRWLRVDLHRRENMKRGRLLAVLGGLKLLNGEGIKTVLVLSNALKGALDRFGYWPQARAIQAAGGLVHEPWPTYRSVLAFLQSANCAGVLTDSGGLQEEASILGVPCLTCRYSTDRVETVLDFHSNLLVPPISAEFLVAGVIEGIRCLSGGLESADRSAVYGHDVATTMVKLLEAKLKRPPA